MREQEWMQSPSYWWPQDRAWVVHSDVDYDSTVLAGSHELVDTLLADEGIECLRVNRRTSLFHDADRVNTS